MSDIPKINHKDLAIERLITQYTESPVLQGYIRALLSESDDLEQVFCDILDKRTIDEANGKVLDVIGDLVGQPRELIDAQLLTFFGYEDADIPTPPPGTGGYGSLASAPVNQTPIVISADSTTEGSVVTAAPGAWIGSPAPALSWQWYKDGIPISGETGVTYTIQAGDDGAFIWCRETASNTEGSDFVDSNQLEVIFAPPSAPYNMFGFLNNANYNVTIANNALLTQDEFSIEAWIELPDTSGTHTIASVWGASGNRAWSLQTSSNLVLLYVSSAGSTSSSAGAFGLTANTLYHVLGSFKNGQLFIFLNGRSVGFSAYSGGVFNSTADMIIGQEAAGTDLMNGAVSCVRYYSKAFLQDDAIRLANLETGEILYPEQVPSEYSAHLEGSWELSDRDDSANDLSGNGLNGVKGSLAGSGGANNTFGSYVEPLTQDYRLFMGDYTGSDVIQVVDEDTLLTLTSLKSGVGNPYGVGCYKERLYVALDDPFNYFEADVNTLGQKTDYRVHPNSQPRGIGGTNTKLVTLAISNNIWAIDPDTLVLDSPVSDSRGSNPRGIGGINNRLYFASSGSNYFQEIDQNTLLNLGSPVTSPLTSPWGMGGTWDRLYATDDTADVRYELDPSTLLIIGPQVATGTSATADIGGKKIQP
jgi:hypothetical protein